MSLRTRRGTYFNAYDSNGPVSAGHSQAHPDPTVSDEIFTLIKVGGSGGNTINHGDLVVIRTRRGTYFNAYDSNGPVSAHATQAHSDPHVRDEIFTILLGLEQIRNAFAYSPETHGLLDGIYQDAGDALSMQRTWTTTPSCSP